MRTNDEVLDAVFGRETRGTPLPRRGVLPKNLSHAWSTLFPGPKPDWYVEPSWVRS